MSRYLVDRIERSPRIEVMTETEVVALRGHTVLEGVTLRGRDGEERVDVHAVFVMIGAEPCTEAVTGLLAVDPAGYLLCGPGAGSCDGRLCWPLGDREPHLLETVRPGVFVAGDVRAGAANRVAGAVGDGAMAIRFVHAVLDGWSAASARPLRRRAPSWGARGPSGRARARRRSRDRRPGAERERRLVRRPGPVVARAVTAAVGAPVHVTSPGGPLGPAPRRRAYPQARVDPLDPGFFVQGAGRGSRGQAEARGERPSGGAPQAPSRSASAPSGSPPR